MSSILGKIPKFTLKLPSALAKAGRTMSECPLELSFSLCDDGSCVKNKTEEQIPLQVKLPQDTEKNDILLVNKEVPEKAEEETSEKQDNMEVTCSVSVDGQEKQEFSFTLYDFDTCDRSNKQDVEKIVVRSICEALNKTLKLPPSGSRTIKVKLAISPDSSKDLDTKEPFIDTIDWPTAEAPNLSPPSKLNDCCSAQNKLNDCCSAQSANTTSTYLPSSLSEKPPKYSSPSLTRSPHVVQKSPANVRAMPSPKLRPYRPHKQEQKIHLKDRLQIRMHASDNRHQLDDNGLNFDEDFLQSHKQPSSRDHVPECRDRRNHYLDLAGVESPKRNNLSQPNHHSESPHADPSLDENHHHGNTRMDAKYLCPYRLMDRTHVCSKPHRTRDCSGSSPLKKSVNYHAKLNGNNEGGSPHMYRTKVNLDPQDDILNFDYDLNDLVPEAKFDWEKPHHRRSKSYDLYESNVMNSGGFYSPKLKPKNNQNWASILESQKFSNHLPSSPGHHYRHRHRDRERQRAMQEVANWIAREHSNPKAETAKHFVRNSIVPNSPHKQLVERHEHHHLHEHVHHHYHHFVEF
ncbi:protein naked cuticle homolog 1-like isoform X2 [Argiope bruennichi]|uniref:Protein naked cuticle homolog n=1 Tax=Argiope bruennichi TaxID=94029 RepID=A0A8T0FC23_ARGBR|nr:protein naked cuticle homolog 1-like isoform X2 [Argiope bruennichi]KAF8787818.1 Protein naked cuticle like protein [Argiope bruennichi]